MNHLYIQTAFRKISKGHFDELPITCHWLSPSKFTVLYHMVNISYNMKAICCMCSSLLTDGPADAASCRLISPLIGSCIVQSSESPLGVIEVQRLFI